MTTTHPRTSVRPASLPVMLLLASLVASIMAAFWAPSADAHALVKATFPADGAVLDAMPEEISLVFNEGVDAPTAALRVHDDHGDRVDVGDASVDPDDGTRIRVAVEPSLGDGTYIVTWRAVSADGHPVKGAWLFSVGASSDVGDDLVAALFSANGDRPVAVLAVMVRALALAGTLLLAGVAMFTMVARDAAGAPSIRSLVRRSALVMLVASLLSIPLQAMLETGLGLAALAPGPMGDVVGSPVGWSALLRAAVAGFLFWRQGASEVDRVTVVAGVVGVTSLALDGHSLTQSPIALIFVGDVVHVVAAAAWVGGLVALWSLVRARRRADDPEGAAQLVAGFSRLATWSLLALLAAGSAMSWVTVRAARALTTTGYGWTLLAKVALVAVLMVVGLYNKRRLVPAIVAARDSETAEDADDLTRRVGDGAWLRLRQTLRLEAVLMASVVAVTAVLVGQQPASQDAGVTGAYTTYADLNAELEVNIVVDPNRAGVNEIHLYLLQRTGRPATSDQVTFILEQPENDLGPFERFPEITGPGHWSLAGRDLAVPGEWLITIVVRTGQFTEDRVTIPVVVNR